MTIDDLVEVLSSRGRLLGVDLGERSVGLAISDANWRVASPHSIHQPKAGQRKFRVRDAVDAVHGQIEGNDIAGVVLGYPLNLSGSRGPRAQASEAFADQWQRRLPHLPVALWDERLSTRAVERAMIAADLSRRQRETRVHSVAAAYILQGALDYARQH